jgi:hypothetical protein
MRLRARSLSLLTALAVLAGPAAAIAGEVKAVVELFTSQGCSSCPKADKLLGELASNPQLIPLTVAVDYWDYLGWRDTLALHSHSLRQKGYSTSRGDRHVYTPQMVLNGAIESIGNDRYAVERAIAKADAKKLLSVPVELKRDDSNIEIEVGAGSGPAGSVWLISVLRQQPVVIERGENRGKTVIYHNVVRGWTRLAEWKGSAVKNTQSIAELAQGGADSIVVIVQNGSVESPGTIRGAAMIALR